MISNMRKIQLVNFETILSNEHLLVSPCNTFTVDNPDAIFDNGRTIWAIYVLKGKEILTPNFLVRRVLFSRLAYIANMKTLLFVPQEYCDNKNVDFLSLFFDSIVYEKDENYAKDLVGYTNEYRRNNDYRINPTVRKNSIVNFWYYRESFFKSGYLPNDFGEWDIDYRNIKIPNPFTRRMESKKKIFAYDNNAILFQKKKKGFLDTYESCLTNIMLHKFTFEQNYVELNRNLKDSSCFLNTNIDFYGERNGMMFLNTMAFMGAMPIAVNNEEKLMERIDSYGRKNI